MVGQIAGHEGGGEGQIKAESQKEEFPKQAGRGWQGLLVGVHCLGGSQEVAER